MVQVVANAGDPFLALRAVSHAGDPCFALIHRFYLPLRKTLAGHKEGIPGFAAVKQFLADPNEFVRTRKYQMYLVGGEFLECLLESNP